jgi:hypothetical protein
MTVAIVSRTRAPAMALQSAGDVGDEQARERAYRGEHEQHGGDATGSPLVVPPRPEEERDDGDAEERAHGQHAEPGS